ncbi:MAG: nucleoside triphosphate pyrophosphohydrolase [Deltaproteobacteria bacterium]|nr:nucleoside triphosphate pyrophosphohydrolase [Deltaproteobacteria bacterium]
MAKGETFSDLVSVMDCLLSETGCPWDREQTLETLKPFLLEETYEVLEALEEGTPKEHCEELGDVLMQVVFQAALREAEGAFTVDDVVRGIADKLRRRHPHVFGEKKLETSKEVLDQWSELKDKEKPRRTLDGVPLALPALARAQRVTERAAQVGFDWPEVQGARDKVTEELAELDKAISSRKTEHVADELGDLLFAVVNLARKLGMDAEGALRATTLRFVKRFEYIEDRLKEKGKSPKQATLEEMDELWDKAKHALRDETCA